MDVIQKKLSEELEKRFSIENNVYNLNMLKEELTEYKKENEALKEQVVNLTSEIYGAKLAAKYLDKELAGRIQQIQLFGKNLKPDQHELLWNQLEAEIHLHRHKTVLKACRNKRGGSQVNKSELVRKQSLVNETTNNLENPASTSTPQKKNNDLSNNNNISNNANRSGDNLTSVVASDLDELKKENQVVGEVRFINLKRENSSEGLGISITGGLEHGVPILVSEIHEDGPAARSGEMYVGDAILAVNDIDLKEASHTEAVEILSNLKGDIRLQLLFAVIDDDSDNDSRVIDYPYLEDDTADSISLKSSIKLNGNGIENQSQSSLHQSDFKFEKTTNNDNNVFVSMSEPTASQQQE